MALQTGIERYRPGGGDTALGLTVNVVLRQIQTDRYRRNDDVFFFISVETYAHMVEWTLWSDRKCAFRTDTKD